MEDQAIMVVKTTCMVASEGELQEMGEVVTEALAAQGLMVTQVVHSWNGVIGDDAEHLDLWVVAREGFTGEAWSDLALAAANALEAIGVRAIEAQLWSGDENAVRDLEDENRATMWHTVSEAVAFRA